MTIKFNRLILQLLIIIGCTTSAFSITKAQQDATPNEKVMSTVLLTGKAPYLISGNKDYSIKVWPNLEEPDSVHALIKHSDEVLALTQTEDEKYLISGGADNQIVIWDWKEQSIITTLTEHQHPVTSLLIINKNDKKWLVSGDNMGYIKLWNYTKTIPKFVQSIKSKKEVGSITSLNIVNDYLLSGHWTGAITVWKFNSDRKKNILKEKKNSLFEPHPHQATVSNLSISPDSTNLVSASWDKTIKIWEIQADKFELKHTIQAHDGSITKSIITEDGKSIISASQDTYLKKWDLATGTLEYTIGQHSKSITSMSLKDNQIITASIDDSIKVWKNQEEVKSFVIPTDQKISIPNTTIDTIKLYVKSLINHLNNISNPQLDTSQRNESMKQLKSDFFNYPADSRIVNNLEDEEAKSTTGQFKAYEYIENIKSWYTSKNRKLKIEITNNQVKQAIKVDNEIQVLVLLERLFMEQDIKSDDNIWINDDPWYIYLTIKQLSLKNIKSIDLNIKEITNKIK